MMPFWGGEEAQYSLRKKDAAAVPASSGGPIVRLADFGLGLAKSC